MRSPRSCVRCSTTRGPPGRAAPELDLAADGAVERPAAAAAHQEVKHDDCPAQRIFKAELVPGKAVGRVKLDRHQKEDQHRDRGKPGEQSRGETEPAEELRGAGDNGPEGGGVKSGLCEKGDVRLAGVEQNEIAVRGHRQSGAEPDEKLGDRRQRPVKAAEGRDQKSWLAAHDRPRLLMTAPPAVSRPAVDGTSLKRGWRGAGAPGLNGILAPSPAPRR